MKKIIGFVLGILLILGSVVGILLSVGGIVMTWRAKPEITRQVSIMFDLVSRSLSATDDLLTSISGTLDQVAISLESVQGIAESTADTINDATPAVDSVGKLVGEDMVKIIGDTQTSLNAVQSSAKLIDDTLLIISSIPLIGAKYAPDIPLSLAIAQMSDSLEPLPDELVKVQDSLEDATGNLGSLQDSVRTMGESMDGLVKSLEQIQPVIDQYQKIMDDVKLGMDNLEQLSLKWLNTVLWVVTVLFIWVGIAQLGLLTQGLELIRGKA